MPLIVSLHRCHGSCNTLDINLSSKIGAPNKTEDVNLNVFNMIPGINESKPLKEHMTYICRCKFGGKKCSSNQKWNNDKCQCNWKKPIKHRLCKKGYAWNLSIYAYQIDEYLKNHIYIKSYDQRFSNYER